MNTSKKYIFIKFVFFVCVTSILSCSNANDSHFSELVKVSMREAGHKLLLANQDSTSLVKPVLYLGEYRFQLSFEVQISIQPDSLVTILKKSFQKANLPLSYLTEVIQCENEEVVYSYQIKSQIEKGIIPCKGRDLPKGCYIIQVRFLNTPASATNYSILYILIIGFLMLLLMYFVFKRNQKTNIEAKKPNTAVKSIGIFQFYPEQNKLIKEAIEINLSKKECELLEIFIAKPNQIIKREELTKKVWEDKGVIVGRSLDTYISKLRKKLKEDTSIKITNVHGVGYKFEVN